MGSPGPFLAFSWHNLRLDLYKMEGMTRRLSGYRDEALRNVMRILCEPQFLLPLSGVPSFLPSSCIRPGREMMSESFCHIVAWFLDSGLLWLAFESL